MDAKLVIVGGKASKGPISLKLPTIIGRSREADLTVAHPMISRQHCKLFEVDGLLKIQDLGSLNGTFVGQEKITEADLHPQTQFTVGPLTFRVDYEYPGPVDTEVPAEQPPAEPPQSAAAESIDAITLGVVPDFLATAAVDSEEAEPQPDPPPGMAAAATEASDFTDLEPDAADQVETEPQPVPDQAAEEDEEDEEAPEESEGQETEETDAEPAAEADPAADPPVVSAAIAEKKGWWKLGKGKKPPSTTKKPAAAATKKPAAGKTSPAAQPAAEAAARAKAAESPPPSGQDEMPDFLASPAPGAGGKSKPADPEEDILDFLR
jgi:predicted component of type VI protein secretion system